MAASNLRQRRGTLLFPGLLLLALASAAEAQQPWLLNGDAANSTPGQGIEVTTDKDAWIAGRRVLRIGEVAAATARWFPAANAGPASTAPAMLVLPGGGYHILADDLEGTEVCAWLNTIGISALLLRYRVPTAEPHAEPLADAVAALALLQRRAKALGIDTGHVGVIGFSAGAHLAARLAQTDPSLPLHALMLIYPAYLQQPGPEALAIGAITSAMPSTFVVQANDDPVGVRNALTVYRALVAAKVMVDLHLYAVGGHGYGLRSTAQPVTHWPEPAERWLVSQGFAPSPAATGVGRPH